MVPKYEERQKSIFRSPIANTNRAYSDNSILLHFYGRNRTLLSKKDPPFSIHIVYLSDITLIKLKNNKFIAKHPFLS